MKARTFTLLPFPETGPLPFLAISGTIARQADTLIIRYRLSGPLTGIEIPAPGHRPTRRIGLWEKTCIEFFMAAKGSPRYWEFNLSPSGDWNVFRFEAYRQGLNEEQAFAVLPFLVRKQSDSLWLDLECDLGRIIPSDQTLEVAAGTVVKTIAGGKSYWALTHPGEAPDFHRRDGFIVTLTD